MKMREKASVQLKEFITSDKRNAWLDRPWGQVYVRNAIRWMPYSRALENTLDVASVEVIEGWRSKGCFTRWLHSVENACRELRRTIYVENVLNERFRQFFIKQGYTPTDHSADYCFYKRLGHSPTPESILTESIKQTAFKNE